MVGYWAFGPFFVDGETIASGDQEVRAAGIRCSHFKTSTVDYAVEIIVLAVGIYTGFVDGVDATAISVDKMDVRPIAWILSLALAIRR